MLIHLHVVRTVKRRLKISENHERHPGHGPLSILTPPSGWRRHILLVSKRAYAHTRKTWTLQNKAGNTLKLQKCQFFLQKALTTRTTQTAQDAGDGWCNL